MADHPPRDPRATPAQGVTGVPVPLVRGHASQEELSAVVAIVAVLAASEGDDSAQADDHPPVSPMPSRSPWNAPARMVRTTYPRGPGGWRASASPR